MIRLPAILLAIALCCLTGQRAIAVSATGGTVTNYTLGGTNWQAHIFTNSGTFTVAAGGSVDALIVAGGGGSSGQYYSGGGGAGGVIVTNISLSPSDYAVVIGPGGLGVGGSTRGNNGSNSLFGVITALGGGAGANQLYNGLSGGSGGGGGADSVGGSGTPGQGFSGGDGGKSGGWGGGGGAGGVGSNGVAGASASGKGGNGITNSFSGVAKIYGGGGGGFPLGPGGLGGGGTGGGDWALPRATPGDPNTGGGAGGACNEATSMAGGSGIVIVRYVAGGAAPVAAAPVRSFYGQNNAIPKWKNQAVKNQESPL